MTEYGTFNYLDCRSYKKAYAQLGSVAFSQTFSKYVAATTSIQSTQTVKAVINNLHDSANQCPMLHGSTKWTASWWNVSAGR